MREDIVDAWEANDKAIRRRMTVAPFMRTRSATDQFDTETPPPAAHEDKAGATILQVVKFFQRENQIVVRRNLQETPGREHAQSWMKNRVVVEVVSDPDKC
jgi:hypothetical protein